MSLGSSCIAHATYTYLLCCYAQVHLQYIYKMLLAKITHNFYSFTFVQSMTIEHLDLAVLSVTFYLFSFTKACPEILVLPAPQHAFDYASPSRLL